MQISEDAHLALLDHVLAEAHEVAGPGAAGIDGGCDARGAAELLGVDAQRGAAPVDMRVQVDQPRRDDMVRHVARVGALQVLADLRHLAARERHVRDGVELLRRIDHAATAQHEVIGHGGAPGLKAARRTCLLYTSRCV